MTHSQRAWRQTIPLAVVILGFGLGYQYAAGGGVFEAESGLVAKAEAMFAELRSAVMSADSSEVDAAEVVASEAPIAESARSASFGFSGGRRSACGH